MKVPDIKPTVFRQSNISNSLHKIISGWCSMAVSSYREWKNRPECGHFFNGVYNYAIDNSATVMATAALCITDNYNEKEIGVSKATLERMTICTIRYLCFTHYTGPEDCVMEKSRNPATSNMKWGFTPGNFFMSSQTGISVSMLGLSAWFMWNKLDSETKGMVGRVLEFYADEYCGMKPGTGVYNDTQCEENAWTSLGISAALYMFPEHPNSDKWMDGYIRWALNTVTTYKDKLSNELDKVTGFSRNGFKYNDKTYGISSVTFHPDLTTENHGYIHPDYMAGGIILRISSSVFPLLQGKEPPGSLLFNMKELYDLVLKPWCGFDGNPIPVQGQDWFYHKHTNKLIIHAAMNLFFNDEDAALFERKCIDIISRRQKSNGNGCLIEKHGELLDVTPGLQSAFDMEYGSIRTVVLSYLLHLLKGDGVNPADEKKVMERLSGAYSYPNGGVYIYRTPDSFSSFTTRCSIMGLTIPGKGLWDITTDFQSYTGIIRAKSVSDSYFRKKKINWMDIGIETVELETDVRKDGFSVTAAVPRAGGAVIQKSSFSALPDGRSVYVEKAMAVEDADIDVYETGRISVGNENFTMLPELAKGYRDIYLNDDATRVYGNYDGDDIKINGKDIHYANIDNRIGYLAYGSDWAEYLNRHKYPKWKGLEDTLVLNKKEPAPMKKGDETDIFAAVSLPNFSNEDTKKEYSKTAVTIVERDLFVIRTGGIRLSVNFSNEDIYVSETVSISEGSIDIYDGLTAVKKTEAIQEYCVKGFSTRADKVRASITPDRDADELDVTCTDGNISIINPGVDDLVYTVTTGEAREKVFHASGKVIGIRTHEAEKNLA